MGLPLLRDTDHLLGLPNLKEVDQLKVDLANKLYKCAIHLSQVCMISGCLVSIKSPARSWLWLLLALLVNGTRNVDFIHWLVDVESVYFDACAHGSARDKRSKPLAHVFFLQPWRPAVPKTMFMLLGSLTKLNKELFSLQQQRQHTMPCWATKWLIAFCR